MVDKPNELLTSLGRVKDWKHTGDATENDLINMGTEKVRRSRREVGSCMPCTTGLEVDSIAAVKSSNSALARTDGNDDPSEMRRLIR